MADNDRAPWQTPTIAAVTDTGARADQATAGIRNGLQDSISSQPV